jgi:glutathione S-transferase
VSTASPPSDGPIELVQFPVSHFNEKARWTLDLKRVPHTRRSLLPGPHAGTVKRLTGQTMVPVLGFGGRWVHGSAQIIDELERRFPEPALYPSDPTLRRRALEVQSKFDDEFAAEIRRSLFAAMLDEPGYIVRLFGGHRSAPVRALYRLSFPIAKGMMKKSMNLADPRAVEAAARRTAEALEFVVKESGPEGYLAGDSFSVADLTAASILAPAADPPNSPMYKPRPIPPNTRAWIERWADHPGSEWVRQIYAKHRPASDHPR